MAADRMLAVAALWAFVAVLSYGRKWAGRDLSRPAFVALAVGILAARAGFVGGNWPAFAAAPWTAAYIWQGGFSPLFGMGAAAAMLIVMLRGKACAFAVAALLAISAAWFVVDRLIAPPARPLPAGLLVERIDGGPVALDSLRGRPFVINLWATWCGPCRREMPMLVETANANPEVPLLLINQGEDVQRVSRYLAAEGLPDARILLDPQGIVGSALRSSALPTTAFVSAEGKVVDVHVGEISMAALITGVHDLRQPAGH
ncbi:TlpA family protein disulfide reductase [Sphingosinithalassobacter sp. LHW66-3]|uniref:TlpA family protein disulfide reductase n=1 Tax=Sphingosinithalassobacter sp. LHW66-3 TaxID=3424718 RepID=UPI003D6B5B2D